MLRLITVLFLLFIVKVGYTQSVVPCRYPLNVSADSLFNFVFTDYNKKRGRIPNEIRNPEWLNTIYSSLKATKFDSALAKCEKFLISRLGEEVYCNYIYLFLNSFRFPGKKVALVYGLELPNLKHNQLCGDGFCEYEVITIAFNMELQSDSSLLITYPKNVPFCNGLPDCGFRVTKDSALAILKENKFIDDSSKYFIETDGTDWIISLEEYAGEEKSVKVNLKTGVMSSIQIYHRID